MNQTYDGEPGEHFDPEARRNPKVPAVPVILADGRIWHFAAATDRYRPSFIGDLCVGAESYRGFPPSCEGPMNALIREASQVDDGTAGVPVSVVIQAAVSLLRRAHNLSAAEAAALLHVGEAELTEIIRGLSAACRGETDAPEDAFSGLDGTEPEGGAE